VDRWQKPTGAGHWFSYLWSDGGLYVEQYEGLSCSLCPFIAEYTKQDGLVSNASDLYTRGAWYGSQLGHLLSCLRVFIILPLVRQLMLEL
jgi:hypothetical protein